MTDTAAIEARHQSQNNALTTGPGPLRVWCMTCAQTWPCDTELMRRERDAEHDLADRLDRELRGLSQAARQAIALVGRYPDVGTGNLVALGTFADAADAAIEAHRKARAS